MRVFYLNKIYFVFTIWLMASLACLTAHAENFRVVEQTTNQGTFYAYHNHTEPNWWHMAVPEVAYYLYNSSRMAFYIRPAQSDNIYQVNLLKRLDKLPAAKMKRQEVDGFSIENFNDLKQWHVYVYNQFCGSILASQNAADDFRLNFVDQVRISQGLRTAFSQNINRNKPCDDFHIPAVMGRLVGYALAIEGRKIKSDVSSIRKENKLPEHYLKVKDIEAAKPLSPDGRLELLLAALDPETRQAYKILTKEKPAESVIHAIKAHLASKD